MQKISPDQLLAPDAEPEASNHWKQYLKPSIQSHGVAISELAAGGMDVGPLKCTGSSPVTMFGARFSRARESFYAVYDPTTRAVYAKAAGAAATLLDAILYIEAPSNTTLPQLPALLEARRVEPETSAHK